MAILERKSEQLVDLTNRNEQQSAAIEALQAEGEQVLLLQSKLQGEKLKALEAAQAARRQVRNCQNNLNF